MSLCALGYIPWAHARGGVCSELHVSYQARAGHERSWHAHVAEQASRLGSEVLEDGAKRRSAARG